MAINREHVRESFPLIQSAFANAGIQLTVTESRYYEPAKANGFPFRGFAISDVIVSFENLEYNFELYTGAPIESRDLPKNWAYLTALEILGSGFGTLTKEKGTDAALRFYLVGRAAADCLIEAAQD